MARKKRSGAPRKRTRSAASEGLIIAPLAGREEFDLLNFMSKVDLKRLLLPYCTLTNLAGGVVRMPEDPDRLPVDEQEIESYRLTTPSVLNPRDFCLSIRSCTQGNRACLASDWKGAKLVSSKRRAKCYTCHMGLVDIVAPINVAGRHVANVYLGQLRPHDLDFQSVWEKYVELQESSGLQQPVVSKRSLQKQFSQLTETTDDHLKYSRQFVEALAELISQRATRQATVLASLHAESEVGTQLNLHSGLRVYLKHAINLLNGDTGTVFLYEPSDQKLIPYAQYWGAGQDMNFWLDARGQKGLTTLCAQQNLKLFTRRTGDPAPDLSRDAPSGAVIRVGSRAEMDRIRVEARPGIRNARQLQSIMIAPIVCGHFFLGTLDVGSTRRNAFSRDDERVLLLFARQVGLYVEHIRERRRLLDVFGQHNATNLARVITEQIPEDVNGAYCSIFVKKTADKAFLFATNELMLQDYDEVPSYSAGEGFTGWVLKTGSVLRVPGGPNCRTENLPEDLVQQGVQWLGKHRDRDPRGKKYYTSAAFLAVPIMTRESKVVGVLRVSECRYGSFTKEDEKCLQAHADALGHLLEVPEEVTGIPVRRTGKVFLGYGRDLDTARCVSAFLKSIGLVVARYDEQAQAGKYARDIVLECMRGCDAAVILVTGDEILDGMPIPRRNVAYEMGLAHGYFGTEKTFVLQQEDTEQFSNVLGLQVVLFHPHQITEKLDELKVYLERANIIRT
jgi:GAF domain-containing protein